MWVRTGSWGSPRSAPGRRLGSAPRRRSRPEKRGFSAVRQRPVKARGPSLSPPREGSTRKAASAVRAGPVDPLPGAPDLSPPPRRRRPRRARAARARSRGPGEPGRARAARRHGPPVEEEVGPVDPGGRDELDVHDPEDEPDVEGGERDQARLPRILHETEPPGTRSVPPARDEAARPRPPRRPPPRRTPGPGAGARPGPPRHGLRRADPLQPRRRRDGRQKGDAVHGLGAGDFEVRHGGRIVEVTNFHEVRGTAFPAVGVEPGVPHRRRRPRTLVAEARPRRRIVLFIDRLQIPDLERRRELFDSLRRFLSETLEENDEAMIVTWERSTRTVLPFTPAPRRARGGPRPDRDPAVGAGRRPRRPRSTSLRGGGRLVPGPGGRSAHRGPTPAGSSRRPSSWPGRPSSR